MTKIDIISGFLGAGKTTLIKKTAPEQVEEQSEETETPVGAGNNDRAE